MIWASTTFCNENEDNDWLLIKDGTFIKYHLLTMILRKEH